MFKMLKKFVPILFVLIFVLTACGSKTIQPFTIKIVSKPACVAPYNWAACIDFTYKGLRLTWGAEKDDNFIAVLNVEDWDMILSGSAYNRHVIKTYMIQSSLLGDSTYGDCGGWRGICYKYAEYADTVKP
jgi:hypothetical protein